MYTPRIQHSTCRDQMNSGRGWELGPRAQSRKWSVMVCFSAMPTEHPRELAPGGCAVGQNDLPSGKYPHLWTGLSGGLKLWENEEGKWMKPTRFCLLLVGQEKEIITKSFYCFLKIFFKEFFWYGPFFEALLFLFFFEALLFLKLFNSVLAYSWLTMLW